MEYREDIEQLFKTTFDDFEADVNPDAWVNIQNGLNIPPAVNPASVANNVATGAKVAAVSTKYIIMVVSAIVGITASVIYFSPDNDIVEKTPVNEIKTAESTLPAVASADAENKDFSDAVTVTAQSQPVSVKEESVDKIDDKVSTAENSSFTSSTNEDIALTESDNKIVEPVSESKNNQPDLKLKNSPASAASVINEDHQKANESGEVSSVQNDEESSSASSEKRAEKSIDEYLEQIPNVITPNGDGDNDAFVIEGKDLVTLNVSIMDRSGKIIHQWSNLHGFWDGKLNNGEPAPTGTYFYNIFAQTKTGLPLSKKGSLHLLLK